VLSLKAFYDGFELLLDQLIDGLAKLLFGFHFLNLEDIILSDDLQNITPGYSFMNEPLNNFAKNSFLDYKLHLERVAVGQYDNEKEFQVYYEKTAIYIYKRILFLIHLTAGQPGRKSELSALLLRNESQAPRNVFILERNQVCIVPTYSKTDNMTQIRSHIARFLPKDVGLPLIVYLLYISPLLWYCMLTSSFGHKAPCNAVYQIKNEGLSASQVGGLLDGFFDQITNGLLDSSGYRSATSPLYAGNRGR
jgi:hypothetical protein